MRLRSLALAILLATPATAGIQPPEPVRGPIRVIDGDTVRLASGEIVRIYNIDAPETHRPRCPAEKRIGEAAATALRAWMTVPDVTISRGEPATGRLRDRYGRTLASLSTAYEGDVGDRLVALGLALPWRTGKAAHDARARHWCGR
ncbi:Micrococcal nuclease-like nuclease [uncultured Pleomorphomonas sp.]|uniref:Micrococcal nuclease-like nuclease n=1 Tax=uncultured Pleomorphomonas sp. TaxID=442121 RepID=A0A212L7E2_9HYPH|nr:thermonuclease family protein [uncultured Pleomorphomonas sp.]SCM73493.1 Micrococcal nuclease-like nuclease [uncultured Pleomorphomonas sp.]